MKLIEKTVLMIPNCQILETVSNGSSINNLRYERFIKFGCITNKPRLHICKDILRKSSN